MTRRRLVGLSLVGERVRLRPHRAEDHRQAYALLAGQEEILRWLVWDGPRSPAELEEYYSHWCFDGESGHDFRLAVEERAPEGLGEAGGGEEAGCTGAMPRLAGSMSLGFHEPPGPGATGDVGYWIGRPYQGRGLGSDALALLTHLAFEHLEVGALVAWVFVGNVASRRVLERCGFTLTRTVPARVRKGGRSVDEWCFLLTRREWRRLRSDFRPRAEDLEWEPPTSGEADDSPTPPAGHG